MKIKDITQIAIMTAVLCVLAPFSVPVGPIPVTLATFAVYLAGATLGRKKGTAALAVYILLGCVGLPVFSGFGSGFSGVVSVTGGYIVGYIPCAFIVGIMTDKIKKIFIYPISMIIGTAVLYGIGTAWYMFSAGASLGIALLVGTVPFLPGDVIKIVAATAIAVPLRKYVK